MFYEFNLNMKSRCDIHKQDLLLFIEKNNYLLFCLKRNNKTKQVKCEEEETNYSYQLLGIFFRLFRFFLSFFSISHTLNTLKSLNRNKNKANCIDKQLYLQFLFIYFVVGSFRTKTKTIKSKINIISSALYLAVSQASMKSFLCNDFRKRCLLAKKPFVFM